MGIARACRRLVSPDGSQLSAVVQPTRLHHNFGRPDLVVQASRLHDSSLGVGRILSEAVTKSPDQSSAPALKKQAMVGQASVPASPRRQGRLRHQTSNVLTNYQRPYRRARSW